MSLRGAVSIARRLQDPLAELVRIDPKAIGVGQYQHDVSQPQLARKLDAVVEDCVNAVGADVNTASAPLLARISGLTPTHRRATSSSFRDEHGPFRNRRQILKVPRLGERTFQQAAGFLRIMDGDNPLDASAVHPEAYPVVERIVARTGVPVRELIGQRRRAAQPHARGVRRRAVRRADGEGHPRRAREAGPRSAPGVPDRGVQGRRPGASAISSRACCSKGVVTNVANFGAFVDVGVHQDGLVHVSQLADRFVKDPREVVKAGDIVQGEGRRGRSEAPAHRAHDEAPGAAAPARAGDAGRRRPPRAVPAAPPRPVCPGDLDGRRVLEAVTFAIGRTSA